MALEDMKSRFSAQSTTFKKDVTAFKSNIEPIKSKVGKNNMSSTQELPKINKPGLNNLKSSINPIRVGDGLAKK